MKKTEEKGKDWDNKGLVSSIKLFWKSGFFSDHKAMTLFGGALFLNLANGLILWIWIEPVDLPIVLHYNVYFGVDVLGDWKEVFFSPLLGWLFLLLNGFLAILFFIRKEIIGSYLLLLGLFFIELSLAIYSLSLIIINY